MGRRQPVKKIVKVEEEKSEEGFVEDRCEEKPPQPPPPVESDGDVVVRLRERWELASVLNFLRVFKSFIGLKMEVSAEEIEEALITPNNTLAQLHIAILKGIPPVSKNLAGSDAWVTVLLKKLTPWWPWVAEGEIPLNVARGEEISRYKELDPMRRLTILKALCEVRADQDDITSHISDALKKEGTEISTFRKERIGGDGNGTSYWYDGDESIGHRLYREVTKVEIMPKLGKGHLTESKNSYQWETIATNLEEFQQISVKLSSSKVAEEAAVAQVIENEIIPELERIEKKKERALKRQQKEEMLLSGALNYYRTENTRSCRSRKPVKYTFDDYDKSIDAALHFIEKGKTTRGQKDVSNGHINGDASNSNSLQNNDDMDIDSDNKKLRGSGGESDTDDGDFDEKDDYNDNKSDEEDDASGESTDSENENNRGTRQHATHRSLKQNALMTRDVTGLRRSRRLTSDAGKTKQHADTKKVLRQRPTRNTVNENVTDSEDGSNDSNEAVSGSDSEDAKSSEKTNNEESGTEESGGVENGLKNDSEDENSKGTGESGGVAVDDNEEESSKGTEESGGVENGSVNDSEEEKNSEDTQGAENGSTDNSEDENGKGGEESPGMEEGSGDESEEENSKGSEENEPMDDSDENNDD